MFPQPTQPKALGARVSNSTHVASSWIWNRKSKREEACPIFRLVDVKRAAVVCAIEWPLLNLPSICEMRCEQSVIWLFIRWMQIRSEGDGNVYIYCFYTWDSVDLQSGLIIIFKIISIHIHLHLSSIPNWNLTSNDSQSSSWRAHLLPTNAIK